jgi:hypothetical protein
MSHSCGEYSVERFLDGKPARGKELFWFFVSEVEKLGPVILHPVKTRVALMVKVRFCAVNKVGRDFIEGHLWLRERVESPKFFKIDDLAGNYVHRFRLRDERDIDVEFRRLLRKAYEIGKRKHLTQRKRS